MTSKKKPRVARGQAHDEGPDSAKLVSAGWRRVETDNAWCWREPKTRALYKLKDALAILYFAHRAGVRPRKGASKT